MTTKKFCDKHFNELKVHQKIYSTLGQVIDQIINVEAKLMKDFKGPRPVKFDILRKPMYKYSKNVVKEFFGSSNELSFLFGWWTQQSDFKSSLEKEL